jgi:hypothetical protein
MFVVIKSTAKIKYGIRTGVVMIFYILYKNNCPNKVSYFFKYRVTQNFWTLQYSASIASTSEVRTAITVYY